NLRLGDRLARTDHGSLSGISPHALDDALTASAVPILQPWRSDGFHPTVQHQPHRVDLLFAPRKWQQMSLASAFTAQPPRDDIGHLFGKQAIAGQLAADHRVQTIRALCRMIADPVVAGQLVFTGPPLVKGRAHTTPGAERTSRAHRWECSFYRLE